MNTDEFEALIAGLESRGYSRSEIAHGARLSRTTVWRLAVGEARQPSYATITRLKAFATEKIGAVPDMKQG
jgi:transcriptional regulator with XRE-family HTH domain